MIFITDRTWEDVIKVHQGQTDEITLSRGTLRPKDFDRWREALSKIDNTIVLPQITFNTLINCTNPRKPIEGATIKPVNDCWYYWEAINSLKEKLPPNSEIDLTDFPSSIDHLTIVNVNALESVIKYFYDALAK